jgi:hypothetical protein
MGTELQFAAVAAYLLWCLLRSLTGVFGRDREGTEPRELIDGNDKNGKAVLPGSRVAHHVHGNWKGVR